MTPLLPSISQPACFSPIGTDQDLQSTLVPTPLSPDISLPASFTSVNLRPTGQSLQFPLTLVHLHYTDKGSMSSEVCQQLGWLVNLEKSELEPKQVFDFVGYQFDVKFGRVRPTPDQWQNLQEKILKLLSLPACPVQQFMSFIGLLTATEKQVYLGRLHMRPIQWHLKNNWSVPESLEKVIPIPRSLHPHLEWWQEEDNVLQGQPLHPIKHALQIFTDASKGGWGAHLNEHAVRGTWSI